MFRPSKQDMDALEKLGNEGWNWESLLHYMKKVCLVVQITFCTSQCLIAPFKSETLVDVSISETDAVTYAAKVQREFHGTDG